MRPSSRGPAILAPARARGGPLVALLPAPKGSRRSAHSAIVANIKAATSVRAAGTARFDNTILSPIPSPLGFTDVILEATTPRVRTLNAGLRRCRSRRRSSRAGEPSAEAVRAEPRLRQNRNVARDWGLSLGGAAPAGSAPATPRSIRRRIANDFEKPRPGHGSDSLGAHGHPVRSGCGAAEARA